MPAIGITGGVACGKSTFTRALAALLPAESFDADAAARELLGGDPAVSNALREVFGSAIFTAMGQIDRAAVRQIVFEAPDKRRSLEAILHPRVRERWRQWVGERLQNAPSAILLVEIPLLYETGAEQFLDHTVVVGCALATQLRRLKANRGIADEQGRQIIASQWDLAEKIRRCSHLVWNDGDTAALHTQAGLCAGLLRALAE